MTQTRRGFSYAETLVATAIVGLVVVATCRVIAGNARSLLAHDRRLHAQALADELMAEILTKAYEDPDQEPAFGPEPGEASRSAFDDVDDYDGWSASPPEDRDGTALTSFAGYVRTVRVEQVSNDDLVTVVSPGSSDFKRVVVEVLFQRKRLARRSVLVSRHREEP